MCGKVALPCEAAISHLIVSGKQCVRLDIAGNLGFDASQPKLRRKLYLLTSISSLVDSVFKASILSIRCLIRAPLVAQRRRETATSDGACVVGLLCYPCRQLTIDIKLPQVLVCMLFALYRLSTGDRTYHGRRFYVQRQKTSDVCRQG